MFSVVQVSGRLKARLVGLEKLLRPLLHGRKAHGRDGRTAKRSDGPARASSPRPVIRGESPPDELLAGIDGPRAHELPWLA